jgi:hypothetical protein
MMSLFNNYKAMRRSKYMLIMNYSLPKFAVPIPVDGLHIFRVPAIHHRGAVTG